jgi:hypothetical protein
MTTNLTICLEASGQRGEIRRGPSSFELKNRPALWHLRPTICLSTTKLPSTVPTYTAAAVPLLLQPPPSPLHAWLSHPGRFRSGVSGRYPGSLTKPSTGTSQDQLVAVREGMQRELGGPIDCGQVLEREFFGPPVVQIAGPPIVAWLLQPPSQGSPVAKRVVHR